jgi:Z1 domain
VNERAKMQDIVGINEIAEMAGVSRQAVTNWRSRTADFPRPIADLASGPVFRRAQIRAWLLRNNRKLGDLNDSLGFYPRLRSFRNDDDALAVCINNVADRLDASATSDQKPGMLLGKIQSGKTRAFVGVIAAAFDKGFDLALVLTKGTKSLSAQTVSRLSSDFSEFIEEDELLVLDIMHLPGKLTRAELRRKIVIVAKKQVKNLERLISFISDQEGLQKRKVLLVDDEADLASIRFVKERDKDALTQGTIAEQMDALRDMSKEVAFLQVTATPYSLYLQPEDYNDSFLADGVFKPKRPAFTELLPIHGGYVGGNDYFEAFEQDDPRAFLINEVAESEQDALRKPDQRRINANHILNNANTTGLVRSIVTFIVASSTRQEQQRHKGEKTNKYSMVIHNDIQRAAHQWQNQVIDWIFDALKHAAEKKPDELKPLFKAAYRDLEKSVKAHGDYMPPEDDCFDMFVDALISEDVVVEKVNSDAEVMNLLDEKSELRMRTPYNIFVGGNILDRGITIPNLIAFYYGRNPKTMQADTVLQHSRMYGNRDRSDLAVTRLYTSRRVYDRLYAINTFENSLRSAFESGAHDQGVVFLQTDDANGRRRNSSEKIKVRPCAPNKVLLSNVVSVSPGAMLLPSDFQTKAGSRMASIQAKLDKLIKQEWRDTGNFIKISKDTGFEIIDEIAKSMEFDAVDFEWDAMRGLIDYYANKDNNDSILLIAETGRALDREKSGDKSGRSILGTVLRDKILNVRRTKPVLVLLQQLGGRERGWTAHPFWWPILAPPTDAAPCVFATKVAN